MFREEVNIFQNSGEIEIINVRNSESLLLIKKPRNLLELLIITFYQERIKCKTVHSPCRPYYRANNLRVDFKSLPVWEVLGGSR